MTERPFKETLKKKRKKQTVAVEESVVDGDVDRSWVGWVTIKQGKNSSFSQDSLFHHDKEVEVY